MNQQKVEQVLKEIFGMYGTEIVRERRRFRSALFDLLSESQYQDERVVFSHALESTAIRFILQGPPFPAEAAQRTAQKLQKECRMFQEDAEFVVRCLIAARGGDVRGLFSHDAPPSNETDASKSWFLLGVNAANSGDPESAFSYWQEAAAQGHAEAAYCLGQFCLEGKEVPQDYSQAAQWYQKAARLGHATAAYRMGWLCQNGYGVRQNYERAAYWYQEAAGLGSAEGAAGLAALCDEGLGVPQDKRAAFEWWLKAEACASAAGQAFENIWNASHPPENKPEPPPSAAADPTPLGLAALVEAFISAYPLIQKGKGEFSERTLDLLRYHFQIPENERVLLAHDDTLWKTGKNGFVLTDRGIYCCFMDGTPTFTDWATFLSSALGKCTWLLGETRLANGNGLSYLSGDVKRVMKTFWQGLQTYLHKNL